ncbi:unnamed protein product (macronuclear) [Paramecium tetraurelia]|uniref:Palmitoyltransferase n=1 Tax=Paramecium tetraurelia TaxID=5888 RepID=A0C5C4_PARTE|nr:uncharacterized protein GSPATT00006490001 [Paramecium tetraurelia]CAK65991.1 unnamed protein product [Paramecium tetraurelia]|eukprot:XP_001433388.1 hypothetical protein (macronuclear) [Paramecium tetraurelia strain d4-2]
MSQKLQIIGRKLVVVIAASVYSLHYWINFNLWITEELNILLYIHMITLNLVFIMLFWCFFVIQKIDPGRPKKADEYNQSPFSKKGFCQQCKCPKPERCHHCSICDRCVLQMDHHCPWINTCVGYQNRKQFILLLFYALLFNSLTIVSTTKSYLLSFQFSYFNIIYGLICLSNYVLVFLLFGFLKYHLELLQKNQTTLEDLISKNNQIIFNLYDIDPHTNICQIFGENKLLWLFPIYTGQGCDDGNSFPKNEYKVMQTPSPQVISVLYEQQQISSDKNKSEHPIIQSLFRREMEKQKINEIMKN